MKVNIALFSESEDFNRKDIPVWSLSTFCLDFSLK